MDSPWPNRTAPLHLSSTPPYQRGAPRTSSAAPLARFMPEAQAVDAELFRPADPSSSDSDAATKLPQRPRHGRSLSHPFPSLFSSRKKKQENPGDADEDSTEECSQATGLHKASPHAANRRHASNNSRDFTTGNCMACGSLVRWPRGLTVFRCTVCLTVNDVVQGSEATESKSGFMSGQRNGGWPEPPLNGQSPGELLVRFGMLQS